MKNVAEIVRAAVEGFPVSGKCGRDQLQGHVASSIEAAGLVADTEDSQQFLRRGMPVWRSKDTNEIEMTTARRRIDIVAYHGGRPIALVEIESELGDLRLSGVTRRNGHYDVFSIAQDSVGQWFHSYKSLERMAAAAQYHAISQQTGEYPDVSVGVAHLERMQSDHPEVHNTSGLELILVSGRCREVDHRILAKRLGSLNAKLICVSGVR